MNATAKYDAPWARCVLPVALTAASFLLAGCGSGQTPTWQASGKVVFPDGSPVTWGVIEFAPIPSGPAARGEIASDGSFVLTTGTRTGAVAGHHQVAIVQVVMVDGAPSQIRHQHKPRLVHGRYNRLETSQLECEISPNHENHLILQVDPADAVQSGGWNRKKTPVDK